MRRFDSGMPLLFMNIINRKTAWNDKDPFAESDRGASGSGKGDKPRNLSDEFKQNFDLINWGPKAPSKPGRTIKRY